MSDPVTNVDIEDVLSSIRKLVSEGEKARTRDSEPVDAPAEAGSQTSESQSGRLVLTPDFRVVDQAAEAESEVETSYMQAGTEPDDPVSEQDEGNAEDWSDETPEPVFHHHSSEVGQEDADDQPEPEVEAEVEPEATSEDAPEFADVEPEQEDVEPEQETGEPLASLEATIAELEAAVSTVAEDYEPDGSEVSAETTRLVWPEPAPEAEPVATDALEPDSFEMSEIDAEEEEAAERFATVDDDLEAWDAPDADGLNDEALREMVADIVREELQGALGERITRNVRKLVRREIYRILASQDFD